ncbi:DUF3653 domain-containing protein [Vibrio litoralis]|uniref:DUF3653 domain-containing protein n=1 Tax=Vibrio litoralis TaxID=335972 RepID=UPI000483834F|nr:DUF3653 domain-containing protein [Vibrio litoralis]
MDISQRSKSKFFIEITCGLSLENAAKLCGKKPSEITEWCKKDTIPSGYKRLMRMNRKLELSNDENWIGFRMESGRLVLPTGDRLTPQQILIGHALLEIGAENELKTITKMAKIAREIARIRNLNK